MTSRAYCVGCKRFAADIPALVAAAQQEGMDAETYAREDGTYNPRNGHFLCDLCYIEQGMPTSPGGWVAP